ncbi:hypothetical protein [Haloferax sp. YSMS24]|uniref:hypothetical protein n=1 Tax=Haloferax sp. YSMS24 TaxID=3388425 RepID=UPI00398D66FD
MNTTALLAAAVFAGGGVALVRYPDRIYEFRHQQMTANPQLNADGRRQYEFIGALCFLFAFAFVLLAVVD